MSLTVSPSRSLCQGSSVQDHVTLSREAAKGLYRTRQRFFGPLRGPQNDQLWREFVLSGMAPHGDMDF